MKEVIILVEGRFVLSALIFWYMNAKSQFQINEKVELKDTILY